MPLVSSLLLPLTAAGILLPSARARRRALVGPLLLALGLASLALTLGAGQPIASLPQSYSAVTAALILIGVAVPAVFAALALRDPAWRGPSRIGALLALAVALVLGLREALPLVRHGGLETLSAAAALLGLAGLFRLTLPRLAASIRWLDAIAFPPPALRAHRWDGTARALLVGTLLLAALACLTPRLDVLLLAAGLGALAGLLLERRVAGLPRWPMITPYALLLLAGLSYLMIHVAGDTPLTLRALVDAPYSPAFELLAVLLLGLIAWPLLGLFPFAPASRGPLGALFAGVLLGRVAGVLLPDGLAHWQPIFYLVPAVAAWHAAATRQDEETLIALASLGALSGSATAAWCALALLAGAALLRAVAWVTAAGRRLNPRGEVLLRVAVIVAAPLLLPLLRGALEAQMFYTVVTVLGVAGSLFGTRAASPR